MSKYFNINMLDDYLELGLKFKVFVDGEYLIVTDPWDLIDNYKAVGYTSKGEPIEFEYMDVDHVMVGSNVFTKDQLNGIDKKEDSEDGGGEETDDTNKEIGAEPETGSEPETGAEGEEEGSQGAESEESNEEQPEEETPE